MRARVTAYGTVQVRDFLVGRVPLLILAVGAAAWGYASLHRLTPAVFDPTAGIDARTQVDRAFSFLLGVFAVAAAALAAQGLVARDRRRGYHRILFARAMSPVRFYVQGFVLAGLTCALLAAVAAESYSTAVRPVSVTGVAIFVLLAWWSVGALGFALSTRLALHTPVLLTLIGLDLALDRYAAALAPSGALAGTITAAQFLLPPGHVVLALRAPIVHGAPVELADLAWPVGFGAACLLAAIMLLRRRPFAL